MYFTDSFFLFYFLPVALILHRVVMGRASGAYPTVARFLLVFLSLFFYCSQATWWAYPFLITVCLDFVLSQKISQTEIPKWRKRFLVLSLVQNLSFLFFFKYYPAIKTLVLSYWPALHNFLPEVTVNNQSIGLPPGISFYTFESISFVVDVYRRKIEAPRKAIDFLSFIAFFPRFIAGPIVRYSEVSGQWARYKGMQLEKGLFFFLYGLCLKVCFADSLALFVNYVADGGSPPSFLSAWVGMIAYSLQLYLDFSGYSWMALGLARCFGFDLPINFQCPYHSTSLQEFWKRWHITLGKWLKDYVYIPLGGNRAHPYRNLLLTFLIGGLWHGAGVTFVVWGLWHGFHLCLERRFQWSDRLSKGVSKVLIFLIVILGWVPFRAPTLSSAGVILKAMLNPFAQESFSLSLEPFRLFPLSLALSLAGCLFVVFIEPRINVRRILEEEISLVHRFTLLPWVLTALILVYGVERLPFLYYQF